MCGVTWCLWGLEVMWWVMWSGHMSFPRITCLGGETCSYNLAIAMFEGQHSGTCLWFLLYLRWCELHLWHFVLILIWIVSSMPVSMSGKLPGTNPLIFQPMHFLTSMMAICKPSIISLRIEIIYFTKWWVISIYRQGEHRWIWTISSTDQALQFQCSVLRSSHCRAQSWSAWQLRPSSWNSKSLVSYLFS
jgi:hypothetical protein